jgi:hypothetical protein
MPIIFIRSISLIIGLLLLILILPHRDPWNSSNIQTSGQVYQSVTIKLPLVNHSISASGGYVFLAEFILLIMLICISSSARRTIANLIRSPRRLVYIIIPLILFLFTLYPTKDGLPIIIYLTVAGVGLLYTLFGIYPILKRLGSKVDLSRITGKFYGLKTRYFVAIIFIIPFILTNVCSYFIFSHVPHVQDNIDQLFHAKIFLNGHLTVPSHQYKEFFDFTHNINNGKWYSEYPPGHTFMLMLGLIIHIPWIINPLLGSASIVLFYFIGREIFNEKTGRLAGLLGIFSPFIIFMSSEFFSHASALFFIALFALFFIKTVSAGNLSKSQRLFFPLLAGIFLGIGFNARMLTAVGVVIPYAIYAIYLIFKKPKTYIPRFAVMLSVFLVFVVILLGFNYYTNGSPLLFGYEALYGKQHNPGFGNSAWGEPHTPLKGLIQDLNDLNALNKYLFEWCIPSTFFVMLFFMGGRRCKWDYILVSSVFSLPFVYFFYWYQGWCLGPRFAYESTLPLILLTARGILHAPDFLKEISKGKDIDQKDENNLSLRFTIHLTIVFCIIIALSINVPLLIKQYANSYWGVNTDVQKAVKLEKISNAVIFVGSYYGSVLAENSPLLDGDIIYVRDLAEKNLLMMKSYPNRRYYLANGKDIQEVYEHYFETGTLVAPNGDFENYFENWSTSGYAWGITDRTRENKVGKLHAESLGGGEQAIGTLRSSNFKISGRFIKFLKNGWDRDPLRPNRYLLKDAKSNKTLRTASPPNQDTFAVQFWNVSDLIGREVYLMIVDNDDDTLKKGGYAWLGIDNIVLIR